MVSDGARGTLKQTADRIVAKGKDVKTFEALIKILKQECTKSRYFQLMKMLYAKMQMI